MLHIEEAKKLTPQEIDKQIDIRKRLIREMIGHLYPSILNSEINQLIQFQKDVHNYSYIIGNYYKEIK